MSLEDSSFVPQLPKSVLGDQAASPFITNLPVQSIQELPTFEKKYHIVNEMGTGQYGTVYKVVQRNVKGQGQQANEEKKFYAAKKMFQKTQDAKQDEIIKKQPEASQ